MAIAKIIDNKSDLDLSVVRHFDNLLKDMYPMAAAQATEQHDELEARNFQVAKETNFPLPYIYTPRNKERAHRDSARQVIFDLGIVSNNREMFIKNYGTKSAFVLPSGNEPVIMGSLKSLAERKHISVHEAADLLRSYYDELPETMVDGHMEKDALLKINQVFGKKTRISI
jgi:hypothetical protein